MAETGYTAQLNANLLANSDTIVNSAIDQNLITSLRGKVNSIGVSLSPERAEQIFDVGYNDRLAFVDRIKAVGVTGVQQTILEEFQARGKALSNIGVSYNAGLGMPHATLKRVDCAGLGLMCGILALMSPPPLDVAMGAAAVAYDALAYFGAC